jgi:uncharacterized protein DUF3862
MLLGILGLVGVIYPSLHTSSMGGDRLPQPALGPPPIVTKAEYNQIRKGMTYERVRRIIGAAGEEISRSDIVGYRTVMYSWTNANGSNMNAMFQNNRLMNKAQSGLP